MSPTSYQLLYPAMLDYKSNNNFHNHKIFLQQTVFFMVMRSDERPSCVKAADTAKC